MQRKALFTDLDGTLIDFNNYGFALTLPRVKNYLEEGWTIVFCSSKTWAEQIALMDAMGITIPAIVENGAGLYLPPEWPQSTQHPLHRICPDGGRLYRLGPTSDEVRAVIHVVEPELGLDLAPYHRLDADQLSDITGLSCDAARRAQARDFSETLTAPLTTEAINRLNTRLAQHQLQAVCGGRFHTVTGMQVEKGKALRTLLALFEATTGDMGWESHGIGDGPNDLSMLQAVDRAYLVQKPDHSWIPTRLPHVQLIPAVGPQGWLLAFPRLIEPLPLR